MKYILCMEKQSSTKRNKSHAKNKKLVALWVTHDMIEALQERADRDEHGNRSEVILRAIEQYLRKRS